MRIMRSTFSILFYINRGKIKADGTTAVMCRITIDGKDSILQEGESIVMPAGHPHAVFGEEQFKMLLVVVF